MNLKYPFVPKKGRNPSKKEEPRTSGTDRTAWTSKRIMAAMDWNHKMLKSMSSENKTKIKNDKAEHKLLVSLRVYKGKQKKTKKKQRRVYKGTTSLFWELARKNNQASSLPVFNRVSES